MQLQSTPALRIPTTGEPLEPLAPKVEDYNDDEMVEVMTAESMREAGKLPAADSMCAAMECIAYVTLTTSTP